MSIAELLVATGLLAIVLVTVMVLFGQLIKNTNKNALMSAGAFVADAVIEKQVNLAEVYIQDPSKASDNGTAAFSLVPNFVKTNTDEYTLAEGETRLSFGDGDDDTATVDRRTRFLYRIVANQVDGYAGTDFGQTWLIKAEVSWWQDTMSGASQTRAGSGNLNVKRTRLIYIRGPR